MLVAPCLALQNGGEDQRVVRQRDRERARGVALADAGECLGRADSLLFRQTGGLHGGISLRRRDCDLAVIRGKTVTAAVAAVVIAVVRREVCVVDGFGAVGAVVAAAEVLTDVAAAVLVGAGAELSPPLRVTRQAEVPGGG